MPPPAAALAPLLLAQLLAPTVQPGPVRLPGPRPLERPPTPLSPKLAPAPLPAEPPSQPSAPSPPSAPGEPEGLLPKVEGLTRFSDAELRRLLQPCLTPSAGPTPNSTEDRLSRCAALLASRLIADGYINSRVFPLPDPPPAGTLLVVEGRIVEVRVNSSNSSLQRRLQRLALPLQGQVLHLPSLEIALAQLEQAPGVGALRASLNRLGGDSTKAVLALDVDPVSRATAGDISLRNDGNSGSGQFRGLAVLARNSLLLPGDQVLLAGELNSTDDPQLGYRSLSLSYRLPLVERLSLTTAAAASWRQLVEEPPPFDSLEYRQQQLFGQLDLTLHEGLRQRLSAFAGLSANRTSAWLNGERFAAILGGAESGTLSSGFLQAGLAWQAAFLPVALEGRLYGLQGLPGFSGTQAIQELAFFGIDVGEARALAADLNGQWLIAPSWQLQLRAAGQLAFQPLTNPMGFSLGSDNGLKGLPGQVISGDSGLLGSGELSWTVWRRRDQALQIVPFLGAGWVSTTLQGYTQSSSIGAGGVLLRWLQGSHWAVELGWASQFGDDLVLGDTNLLVDSGLYTKMSYRF